MTLLVPIGLIGLLGVVALIIIYIIKPNYQQRNVSTTFVWNLSLKYKKKRIPVSKLRNIIIFILQMLILTSLAFILAKPALVLKEQTDVTEVVAILDASASMRTETDDTTRFERAVKDIEELADKTIDGDGMVSVIFAGSDPYFLSYRNTAETKTQLKEALSELLADDTMCTYGTADVNEAIAICDEIVKDNPSAKIYFYTDKKYEFPPAGVNIIDESDEDEWNAAVINAYAEMQDNSYVFTVEVGVYGIDSELDVIVDVYGANATAAMPDGMGFTYRTTVECYDDNVVTVIFMYDDGNLPDYLDKENFYLVALDYGERAFSFDYANISLAVDDDFAVDNNFSIYGGRKESIKILYESPMRNTFVNGMLDIYTHRTSDDYDIEYTAPLHAGMTTNGVITGNIKNYQEELITEGYDVYIYEHIMPRQLPTDGLVILINPDSSPNGAEFSVSGEYTSPGKRPIPLVKEDESHPLASKVNFNDVTVTKYVRITNLGGGYDVLATCDGNPVVFARNDENLQTLVIGFSEHYSNISIKTAFPMLFINLFRYYFPDVVSSNSVEVYGSVSINPRGSLVTVTGYQFDEEITEFPAQLTFNTPGSYTVSQTTYFEEDMTDNIFVRIPAAESNIRAVGDTFDAPYFAVDDADYFKDLLLYLEIAVLAILFAEWIMHLFEGV